MINQKKQLTLTQGLVMWHGCWTLTPSWCFAPRSKRLCVIVIRPPDQMDLSHWVIESPSHVTPENKKLQCWPLTCWCPQCLHCPLFTCVCMIYKYFILLSVYYFVYYFISYFLSGCFAATQTEVVAFEFCGSVVLLCSHPEGLFLESHDLLHHQPLSSSLPWTSHFLLPGKQDSLPGGSKLSSQQQTHWEEVHTHI